jgi:hypothetical protein
MGWLFTNGQNRKSLIEQQTKNRDWKNKDGSEVTTRALKHCYKGGLRAGVLYIVWERVTTSATGAKETTRFIEIDMLQYSNSGGLKGWGYKDMDCCSGPYQTSCPVSYLDLCPPHEGSKWCAGWHEKVRAAASKRTDARKLVNSLKVGDVIELVPGCNFSTLTVTSVKPFRANGMKVPAKLIARVIPKEPVPV